MIRKCRKYFVRQFIETKNCCPNDVCALKMHPIWAKQATQFRNCTTPPELITLQAKYSCFYLRIRLPCPDWHYSCHLRTDCSPAKPCTSFDHPEVSVWVQDRPQWPCRCCQACPRLRNPVCTSGPLGGWKAPCNCSVYLYICQFRSSNIVACL